MKILLVEPGCVPAVQDIDGSLEEMQNLVGGLIEALYPFDDPVAMVCNDEGKLLGLPLNRALYTPEGELYDIVSGPFFLCGLSEEDFASLPDELIEKYEAKYHCPELFIRA